MPANPIHADPDRRWLVVGAAAFGVLILGVLPEGVAALNDDFGYLRSVVETIRRGRPWTDDWLEPWSASLSAISALFYRLTGSFESGIHGALTLYAALAFGVATLLFRARSLGSAASLACAFLLLSFPTMLWKAVEFTSVALYLPCLLLAIWSAEREKWTWFGLAWIAALASRQSAVSWGLIPLLALIREGVPVFGSADRRHADRGWLAPLAVLGAAMGAFFALQAGMNQTHSQRVLTAHVGTWVTPHDFVVTLALGTWVYATALGLGVWLAQPPRARLRSPRERVSGALAFAVFVGFSAWFANNVHRIGIEHSLFRNPFAAVGAVVLFGMAAGGWWRRPTAPRIDFALAAFGSLGLVALRGAAWDYYFIDAALFGLFGTVPREISQNASAPLVMPRIRAACAIVLVFIHGVFVLDLKTHVDRAFALCVISETALRENRLHPSELTFVPFGFLGWHLHRHFMHNEGRGSSNIAGFGCYLRPGAVEVGQGYSRSLHFFRRFRHEPPADRTHLIGWGRHSFVGVFSAEFYLLRFKSEAESPAAVKLPRSYEPQRFPLSDTEWRALIESGGSN